MPNKIFDNNMLEFPHISIPDYSMLNSAILDTPLPSIYELYPEMKYYHKCLEIEKNLIPDIEQQVAQDAKQKFYIEQKFIKDMEQRINIENRYIDTMQIKMREIMSSINNVSNLISFHLTENLDNLVSTFQELSTLVPINDIQVAEKINSNYNISSIDESKPKQLEKDDVFKNLPTYQKLSIMSDYFEKLITFITFLLTFVANVSSDGNITNNETENIQNNVTININQYECDEILDKLTDLQNQIDILKEQTLATEESTETTLTSD